MAARGGRRCTRQRCVLPPSKVTTQNTADIILNYQAVHFCARNVPFISGRVLVQVSPRYVNDRDAIIRQCHSFAEIFEEVGVSRNRYAIKIPFTGAAASASRELNGEGMRTLATTVFSLEQAIAAGQSNCLFISPYFNGKCYFTCISIAL